MVDFKLSKWILIALLLTNSAWAADGYTEVLSNNGILFEYKIRNNFIDARVTCDTTGWVAVGFDPDQQMARSNIIIGYVDQEQGVHVRDDYGVDQTHHKADTVLGGMDHVTNASGSEADGITRVAFTIPLNSGDPNDTVLTLGMKHKIILGCGKDGFDNFVTIHKKVALIEVMLDAPQRSQQHQRQEQRKQDQD